MQTQFITGGTVTLAPNLWLIREKAPLSYMILRTFWACGAIICCAILLSMPVLAAPTCTANLSPQLTGRLPAIPALRAPDRLVGGAPNPIIGYYAYGPITLNCSGVTPNKTFYIGMLGLIPTSGNSALQVQYISYHEIRSLSDMNSPGHKVKIGDTPDPNKSNIYDNSPIGVRELSGGGALTCSGGSGTAYVGDATNNKGYPIGLLSCKTSSSGELWITRQGVVFELYQATTDGAVGELTANLSGADYSPLSLTTSSNPRPFVSAGGYNVNVITSPNRNDVVDWLNQGRTASICTRNGQTGVTMLTSACGLYLEGIAALNWSGQPAAPSICHVSLNGTSNALVSWGNAVPSSSFGTPGAELAPPQTLAIQLDCSGPGAASFKNIILTARGEPSRVNSAYFSSDNDSVDFKVVVNQNNKAIVPNSVQTLTKSDGVVYNAAGGSSVGSVDLTVTPVAAQSTPIPGRADSRIILDIYAGI